MIDRFRRIKYEFGTLMLVRTVFLLFGLVGLSIMGFVVFESPLATIVSVIGLVLGWILRRTIVAQAELLFWVLPTGLFIYGIVLFIGENLALSRNNQLLIITITTVVLFGIQFWSLSDPSIVNTERETDD